MPNLDEGEELKENESLEQTILKKCTLVARDFSGLFRHYNFFKDRPYGLIHIGSSFLFFSWKYRSWESFNLQHLFIKNLWPERTVIWRSTTWSREFLGLFWQTSHKKEWILFGQFSIIISSLA
jgi:hypothetical protein